MTSKKKNTQNSHVKVPVPRREGARPHGALRKRLAGLRQKPARKGA